jgi:hypothetical protein
LPCSSFILFLLFNSFPCLKPFTFFTSFPLFYSFPSFNSFPILQGFRPCFSHFNYCGGETLVTSLTPTPLLYFFIIVFHF